MIEDIMWVPLHIFKEKVGSEGKSGTVLVVKVDGKWQKIRENEVSVLDSDFWSDKWQP